MSKRWTPQQFIIQRRIRVILCVVLVTLSMILSFVLTARKSVALSVNGETRQVTTYAFSVDELLKQEGIERKTHDFVETSASGRLVNHGTVTFQSAYQTTISIDGQEVPFWTTATSADQLLGFFETNRRNAAKITVNIKNVYNQLTGGFAIDEEGPVTVIADGKESVAADGKLPAASILDSKGIVLGREDRVSVEKTDNKTILRVQRITHGETSEEIVVPFETRTVVDSSLPSGQTIVRQQGKPGKKTRTYQTTFVDGVAESSVLTKEEVTSQPIDQVIAIGSATPESTTKDNPQTDPLADDKKTEEKEKEEKEEKEKQKQETSNKNNHESNKTQPNSTPTASPAPSQPTEKPSQQPTESPAPAPSQPPTQNPAPAPKPTQPPTPEPNGRLWHASPAQAQTYAGAVCAQKGWTGQQFDDLISLWNRESGWRWWAENKYSGAYGIPQAYPGNKMAQFGNNWKDDAAVQIDWGLYYIANRYGTPSDAWAYFLKNGSY